ncbi:MAG: hypothetical protein QME40_04150 [bacterium]|nr:hypothetical protein [bacterium]
MKKHLSVITGAFLLLLLISSVALAQGIEDKTKRFGLGLQCSFPAWGISGMMDVADNLSLQGVLDLFGDLKTYAGRGIYRFNKEPYWNVYGYGMIGAWSYSYYYGWPIYLKITETVMGFGAGVGIEYDWKALSPDLPPICWNLEAGLGSVGFKKVYYPFSTFMIGVGAHYRF